VILIVDRSSKLKERHLAQAPLLLRAGVIEVREDQIHVLISKDIVFRNRSEVAPGREGLLMFEGFVVAKEACK
jgi:hypothetical protein